MALSERFRVVEEILRQLAITESERRLFLSYRRQDVEHLAEQLRHGLIDHSFDVFMDRFTIKPAEDFQIRLDIELADKAFVLLIESRTAKESEWIDHEVSFANNHGLAILPLSMPSLTEAQRFPVVASAERYELELRDFEADTGRLAAEPLGRVLEEAELRHATALRLRRDNLVDSTHAYLRSAGFEVQPLSQWSLLAQHSDGRRSVFLVTPRRPIVADLRELDDLCSRVEAEGAPPGVLVHNTAARDAAAAALLTWAAAHRPLRVASLLELEASLGHG